MPNRRWSTAWRLLRSGEYQEFFSRFRKFIIHSTSVKNELEYSQWRQKWVDLNEETRQQLKNNMELFSSTPNFTLILDASDWNEFSLFETIDSVIHQLYPNWVIQVVDQSKLNSTLSKKIDELEDNRIKITSFSSIETSDWVTKLPPMTRLHEAALLSMVSSINNDPKIMLLYTDHDHLDTEGNFCDPHMKPAWNYDLFASINYLDPFVVLKKELWLSIKDKPSDQHLFLTQAVDSLSQNEICHIPQVLASVEIKNNGTHLEPPCRRTTYEIPDPAPTVSILIPTRDRGKMLERCLNSIYEITDYPNFEIVLVDHETSEVNALNVIKRFEKFENLKVLNFEGHFNFSKIMNKAAEASEGHILISLNNDTEIVDAGWLTELVAQVSRVDVGVVGALLLFKDRTIQHAGIHPGEGGLMGHGHKHLPEGSGGYFNRLNAVHEVAAVTGACMAVKRSTWFELGGLDEENLAVAYNDVDLCLKARKHGLKVIFTPYAKVVHHESVSRGVDDNPETNERLRKELETMNSRWGEALIEDPAYSPNLSYDGGSFMLSEKPRSIKWLKT